MPEQCFRRLRSALVANLDDQLRIWQAPSAPSDMPSLALTELHVPAERIYIYPLSFESAFPQAWPFIFFDSPTTERERVESNANRTRYDYHNFDLVIGVKGHGTGGSDGMERTWSVAYRLGSAVRDVLEKNAVSGAAVDDTGSPYDVTVTNTAWGDTTEMDQGGAAVFVRHSVIASERRTTTYTSI